MIKNHIPILLDDEGDVQSDHRKMITSKSQIISTRLNRNKFDISSYFYKILRQHLFSTWIFCCISNILNIAVDNRASLLIPLNQ